MLAALPPDSITHQMVVETAIFQTVFYEDITFAYAIINCAIQCPFTTISHTMFIIDFDIHGYIMLAIWKVQRKADSVGS